MMVLNIQHSTRFSSLLPAASSVHAVTPVAVDGINKRQCSHRGRRSATCLCCCSSSALLHHQSPHPHPRPPPHQEPATTHFPASIHDYQQEHSENFTSPPPTTCGEQEPEPLTVEVDNEDYSTTTDHQAVVPAAVLMHRLNSSGNATTRVEAV
jgi:hypothetical protein